ncbi:MAG TPA: L-histidine N(alpha)-methyltransferase [Actinomycetota bacterium]|nr:L-histidine N(alpha)-methyltransferase [Actinomycetota bacterium]
MTVEVHLGPDDLHEALKRDVLKGLTSEPKALPPKWFYDEEGSRLFDLITRLPEYYQTRAEREILLSRAGEIQALAGCATLVELGSGTSEKTRILLDAMTAGARLRRFVPFDVSEQTLRDAATDISTAYPDLHVHAVVGDFERHLQSLPRDEPKLVAFLGGTIGNLEPRVRKAFLRDLASSMPAGDWLLLGTDLVKDVARMEAAYNDADGVTAEFNRNILRVLNSSLRAGFEPDRFDHVARYDEREGWIEMALRSKVDQSARVEALDLKIGFRSGELLRTETSAKFTRKVVERELAAAGLTLLRWWTDAAGDFALSLSRLD